MTDLEKLIEAVEAGTLDGTDIPEYTPLLALPRSVRLTARAAYNGGLDAAKDFHDEVLPDARVEMFGPTRAGEWGVNLPSFGIDTAFAEEPARAWLLAILRALQSQVKA